MTGKSVQLIPALGHINIASQIDQLITRGGERF